MTASEIMNAVGCRGGVAEDAEVGGYLPRLIRDNALIGDRWVGLWNCAGVEALDFAGSTLWRTEHAEDEWQAMVAQRFDGAA